MKHLDYRHYLEIANGLWMIIAFWLIVFLAYHIIVVGKQRHIHGKKWIDLPLSMQLAVAVWFSSVGICTTRIIIWWSRFQNDGYVEMQSFDTFGFLIGTMIGLAGFLCLLRVVTRPMLGDWPWTSALTCCALYILWSVERLIN